MSDIEWKEAVSAGLHTRIALVANVYIRSVEFLAVGDVMPGHLHPFDHSTLLARGRVRAEVDGQATEFTAPAVIYVRADKVHRFTALEPGTLLYCIHAQRFGEGVDEIIDPASVPAGSAVRPEMQKVAFKP